MAWYLADEQRDDSGIERTYRWDAGDRADMILSVVWQEVGYDLTITFSYPSTDDSRNRPGDQQCMLPWPASTLVWQLLCQAQVKSGDHWALALPETFGDESVIEGATLGALMAEASGTLVRRDDIVTMRQLVREYDQEQDRLFLEREAEDDEVE